MRPRINQAINVNDIVNEIERRIEVKKELVYVTSRINKCSFNEAKKDIYKADRKWSTTWGQIKYHVKQLDK